MRHDRDADRKTDTDAWLLDTGCGWLGRHRRHRTPAEIQVRSTSLFAGHIPVVTVTRVMSLHDVAIVADVRVL